MDNADKEVFKAIARLRLARVEAARGDLDKALQLVQGIDAGEMKSAYEEVKGDFYLEQGNNSAAYSAYQSALATETSGEASVVARLEFKINFVQPAQVEEPVTEE